MNRSLASRRQGWRVSNRRGALYLAPRWLSFVQFRAPFPAKTLAAPVETFFLDWRRRLKRNLSRRSDSRWDPLTRVHAAVDLDSFK